MTEIIRYSIDDIKSFVNIYNYELSDKVNEIIKHLDSIIIVNDELDPIPLRKNDRSFDRSGKNKNRRKNFSKSSSYNDINIDDWEAIRNFKATEKRQQDDIEKEFSNVRVCLNKLSRSNFEIQKDELMQILSKFFKTDNKEFSENKDKIANTIFDICSTNKFLSEIYSELYVELVGYDDIFGNLLDSYIDKYKGFLDNIKYVDPEVDYEGFCDYNKLNEMRKSNSSFLINLMKHDMISKQAVIELIINLQDKMYSFIDEENKLHEVEEITENLFILIQNGKLILQDNENWTSNIVKNVSMFTKLKAKEHKSLSSRCIFKHMDMSE